jgi:hypothetical protein
MESKMGLLGTSSTSGLLYLPRVIVTMENSLEWRLAGETELPRENLPPAPLCPPQIPLDQTWARSRAAAVGSQRLTTWAMARPYMWTLLASHCNTGFESTLSCRSHMLTHSHCPVIGSKRIHPVGAQPHKLILHPLIGGWTEVRMIHTEHNWRQ